MKTYLKPTAAAVVLALAAGPAAAVDYFLCAGASIKTLPDGSSVPIWGYAEDDNGDLSDGCGNPVTVPGPRLTVPDGDSVLNVNLLNELPEPGSIVIPGLPMPTSTGNGPTWDDGTTGPRGGDPTKRVRSFGAEAAAAGGIESYGFSVGRPGTFIYHSGTHPQKQVYMGLYGAATKDNGLSEAYPGVPYDNEVVLFYSEIDPDLNAAVHELHNPTGTVDPYTTSIHYNARWFLINGEPYVDGVTPPIPISTPAGNGGRTLLRFLSAAGEIHVPVLQGMHMTIHAEDGLQYGWEDTTSAASGTAPREQYSAMLPALKTKDAVIQMADKGWKAIYDGNGYMTNPSDTTDVNVGDTVGGMLRFLSFETQLHFSTISGGNSNPVADVPGPYDDADIYFHTDAATPAFARIFDGDVDGDLPNEADIDGLAIVDADTFYVSFERNDGTNIPGLGIVQDEDVVLYDAGTWSLFFDGSACGLDLGDTSSHQGAKDIDALDVINGQIFFSTFGTGTIAEVLGVDPPYDDADIYKWDGSACSRVFDARNGVDLLPGAANIDGLTVVDEDSFYVSFTGSGSAQTVDVSGLGPVDDEDVILYDAGTWTYYFDGSVGGLDATNGQDLDAIDVP